MNYLTPNKTLVLQPGMNKNKYLIFIIALATATMFANIGGLDIYALDEAKNAEAAREMMESGELVVPYFNYELRTDKPPLHYYFMIIGYELFGTNAFGARFFSSIFGVLTVVLVYLFSLKHFGQRSALFSSLVLISSIHTALQFHMSVPDPYLIFFLTWAFFSFYNAYLSNNKWQLLAFYFAIGCGILVKGPIALGLAGLTVVLFLLLQKDFNLKTILRLQPISGVILSLGVAFPWYYIVHVKTGGVWTDAFFFKHNFNRFSEAMEGHNAIFLRTFAYVFLLGMLAFTPFIIQSIKSAWVERRENANLNYLISGVIIIVGFFAISSTKLPNYTTPAYPLLALILGYYLAKIDDSWFHNKWNRIGMWAYSVLLIVFPIGIYFGISGDRSLSHLTHLALYFIPLSLVGVYLVYQLLKARDMNRLIFVNVGGWIITIILFFFLAYPQVDAENPVRKTLPVMNTDQKIIAYKRLNAAYVFKLQRQISRYDNLEMIRTAMRQNPSGYVISRTEYREELETIEGLNYLTEERDTFENPKTLIMTWGN